MEVDVTEMTYGNVEWKRTEKRNQTRRVRCRLLTNVTSRKRVEDVRTCGARAYRPYEAFPNGARC